MVSNCTVLLLLTLLLTSGINSFPIPPKLPTPEELRPVVVQSDLLRVHAPQSSFLRLHYIENVTLQIGIGAFVRAQKLTLILANIHDLMHALNSPHQLFNACIGAIAKQTTITTEHGYTVQADRLTINTAKQQALLHGNVCIDAPSLGEHALGCSIKCLQAFLDLATFSVRLIGTSNNPVHTHVTLKNQLS